MRPSERFYESKSDFRDPYSRDRDRIIHCSSFRRLEYKTQVFLNSVGDFFRTRLTHSLEVSQIARAIAKEIGLNEVLCEAIALSHDLGHTPFGHAGGDELNSLLKNYGSGFDHNFQSFRVVSKLEKRYAHFDGLNLTFATLEGILKHSAPYRKPFLGQAIDDVFLLDYHPSLEAMVVDFADEIAYVSHDIDDGLQCGFLKLEHIRENELIHRALQEVQKEGVKEQDFVFRTRMVSALINHLVFAFITYSKKSSYLHANEPCCAMLKSDEDVGIGFEKQTHTELKKLKKILYQKLYYHEEVKRKMCFGRLCIHSLFEDFMNDTGLLPMEYRLRIENERPYRVVADYIASMSDRFAIKLYRELHVG